MKRACKIITPKSIIKTCASSTDIEAQICIGVIYDCNIKY